MVNTKGQDVVKIQKNHGKEAGTAMTAPQKIHAYEYGIMFLLGCFIYSLLEIAARGYTHWTMTLLGGIVGMLLYRLHGTAPRHTLLLQALSGAFIITALEMVVGVLDNLVLQWHVWSYREMPWNVYGQICLPFSVLWFLVCIPALGICEVVRKRFQ
ncbi:MAG: hypothetical protein V8T91_11425 [Ruminococcus sp.]|jgi:uncharacterized membrane protein|uniref:putative ABC transporter permease n=1 Tax=Ruminococcus sp. TaxID=41978 RepID=UPI002EBD6733|nr:hypothetical protein [Ruminococcus sp.]MED9911342.1 hypothetical protein [Ruminococcus sp.]MEE0115777.1 hypothetical protein [Ruminococcus sp.]MEE0379429.1 hypothetical protein [Ruminococcus sp.]